MKCEICHKADASQAIVRREGDGESELYVCAGCAAKEHARRQNKSHRTRKGAAGDANVSITVGGIASGGEPPAFLGAILDAMNGMVSEISGLKSGGKKTKDEKYRAFSCAKVDSKFRIRGLLHLEGLSLIGDLDGVHRAARALRCRLVAVSTDGKSDPAHAYSVEYRCSPDCVGRLVASIVEQERVARIHLLEQYPRVFGDALCRALAILKNCRMVSAIELFDLLSPLRLAAIENLIEGVDRRSIEKLMTKLDLNGASSDDPDECDRIDADRADRVNDCFRDVVLNERAEGKFL